MPARRLLILATLSVGAHPLSAQLYLIAGSPTPKYNSTYATKILAVTADGKLSDAGEVYSKDQGLEWVAASDELGAAVVLAKGGSQATVIDFREASASKRCTWPLRRGESLIDRWIVDSPISGPLFVELLAGDDVTKAHLTGMILDASAPCEKSFLDLDPADMKDVRAGGSSGLADTGDGDGLAQVEVGRGGDITRWFPGGTAPLGYQVPPEISKAIASSFLVVQVNTKGLLALSATEYSSPGESRVLVLRKRDNTWWPLPFATGIAWALRGFGTYVTFAEARVKGTRLKESAGRAEWRTQNGETGPGVASRFDSSRYAFSGVLHIYDVESGRSYGINTAQGDSEILLISGHTAYYRVNDRLYSVEISDAGLGEARLLATSDLVRDAHWAFRRQ